MEFSLPLHLFPAWPAEWNVDFKLHAPGKTVVECVYRGGKVEKLERPKIDYVGLVSLLNLGYLREAWRLWRDYSDTRARHAFRYSLIYLTGLFAALFLDRLA